MGKITPKPDFICNDSSVYGEHDRSPDVDSRIIDIVKRILTFPIKFLVFPSSTFIKAKYIDPARVEKTIEKLQAIGGKRVTLETPDGEKLDGMHFKAKDFKEKLEQYFMVVEDVDSRGNPIKYLALKPDYYTVAGGKQFINHEEANKFYNQAKEVLTCIPFKKIKGLNGVTGPAFPLSNSILREVETQVTDSGNPTAILCTSQLMQYSGFKILIREYLLNGIDVMVFDYRGTGKSTGNPTDKKLCLDAETAFQYIKQQHGVKNEDILIHGYCFGGGPATDVASRHEGVNLLLDRSYGAFEDIAAKKISIISRVIKFFLPFLARFDNAKKIPNVTGNIAIEMDEKDETIEEEDIIKIINHLSDTQEGQVMTLIESGIGHQGIWAHEAVVRDKFQSFLDRSHLRRKMF